MIGGELCFLFVSFACFVQGFFAKIRWPSTAVLFSRMGLAGAAGYMRPCSARSTEPAPPLVALVW